MQKTAEARLIAALVSFVLQVTTAGNYEHDYQNKRRHLTLGAVEAWYDILSWPMTLESRKLGTCAGAYC